MEDRNGNSDLIGYFKTVVWIASIAITAIVSASLIFAYSSVSDLKSDLKNSMDVIEKKATDGLISYQTAIDNYRIYSENTLDRTQEFTINQIEQIAHTANQLAISTANNRIDEAFKSPEINRMIEHSGSRLISEFISYRLDSMVNDANNIISNQIKLVPDLILGVDLIRNGSRRAWNSLDSIAKTTSDSLITSLIQNILLEKSKQYTTLAKNIFIQVDSSLSSGYYEVGFISYEIEFLKEMSKTKDTLNIIDELLIDVESNQYVFEYNSLVLGTIRSYNVKNKSIDTRLIEIANNSENLNLIALVFYLLHERGYKIEMFEFDKLTELSAR